MHQTKLLLAICVICLSFALPTPVRAEVSEHPLMRPFPGSTLDPRGEYQDLSEYGFTVIDPETGKKMKESVQGRFWKLTYGLRDETGRNADKSHSVLEYRENYKQAALEQGGEILYEDGGYLTFRIPGDGVRTWCEVHIWNYSQQDLRIIEEAGFEKSLTFGPAEMKAALDEDGHVALYGILFDVDAATLKQESTEELQHIVTLLCDNPDLKLEVQGHTDDQGGDDYNMTLSQRRAETVVSHLGLFGIDTARLTAKGYGETSPVAPNTTEEGRARNRRVELVKPGAAGTAATGGIRSSEATGAGSSMAEDVEAEAETGATVDLSHMVLGKWNLLSSERVVSGHVTFSPNGMYEMREEHGDGTGVTREGQYSLDESASPARIELCLGDCGGEGSQWTSIFGIVRALSDKKVEMRFSEDGNYPVEFSSGGSGGVTQMLARAE